MSTQTEVERLAKRIATEIRSSKPGPRLMEGRSYLETNPDAILPVLALLRREANRKKPNDALVQGYLYLLATGLELLRYRIERGYEWAEDLVGQVRTELLAAAEKGTMSGALLTRILNAFREVRLDTGEELTSALGELAKEEGTETARLEPRELNELFAEMVEAFGENEFDIYEGMAEFSLPMPTDFRQMMTAVLTSSSLAALRETATLSLLDPSADVRRATCQALERTASPSTMSSVTLRRMIAVRNWLPEGDRHCLDAAIRRARRNGVECAPWPLAEKVETFASAIDGAGAQSVIAISKTGRKHRLSNLLVKQGVGIADTWCLRDQSKTEVASFMVNVHDSIFLIPVARGLVEILVRHNLAVGEARGGMPPVGMIDFVEAIGMTETQPQPMTVESLVSQMEREVDPAVLRPKAVERALAESGEWPYILPFGESWFEDDAEVRAFLKKNKRIRDAARVDRVVDVVLEGRRGKWAERFAWTALWTKHATDQSGPWHEFMLLAREIERGRSLRTIPIMRAIAEQTVLAAT